MKFTVFYDSHVSCLRGSFDHFEREFIFKSNDISTIALGYGLDDQGFESRKGLGIFLFTTAFRPALGPTQPPIQWV
jgi:hypothetical protein